MTETKRTLIRLAQSTSTLTETCTTLRDNVAADIAAAVLASQNETIIPLANVVTRQITLETLFINTLNQ